MARPFGGMDVEKVDAPGRAALPSAVSTGQKSKREARCVEVKRIFGLRQELIRFKRIIGPMTEVCGRLVHLDTPCLDANARPYFQDVLDHVRRVDAMVNSLRDVLTSVFEVSNLLEQQRQGVITRQLAAWAAILAVPTAIAVIYGMNFENMPELKTQYGYFVVVGIIVVLCTVLYLRFKRARWL